MKKLIAALLVMTATSFGSYCPNPIKIPTPIIVFSQPMLFKQCAIDNAEMKACLIVKPPLKVISIKTWKTKSELWVCKLKVKRVFTN